MIMVIDTDILIDLGDGVAEAMARVKTEALTNKLTVSVITKLELLVGCQNKTEMRSLEQFLVQFDVIPLSAAIGNQAVNLLKQYRLSHGLLMLSTEAEILRYFPSPPAPSQRERGERKYEKIYASVLRCANCCHCVNS